MTRDHYVKQWVEFYGPGTEYASHTPDVDLGQVFDWLVKLSLVQGEEPRY